jgi:5,10-methylenetetrahydromethanopterin reductase
MGAASQVTKKIILGTLVSSIVTREPVILANSIYTLKELSGGRAVLGIGTGDTSLKKLNKKAADTQQLTRAVECIRKLTNGEGYDFGTGQFGFNFAKNSGIPIFIAATGPKMLRLSGKISDTTVVNVGLALADWALKHVEIGVAERAPDMGHHKIMNFSFTSVHEDRSTAIKNVKANLLWYCLNIAELVKQVEPELDRAFWDKVTELKNIRNITSNDYLTLQKEIVRSIPDRFVDKFALAGNPDDITQKVRELERKGFAGVVVRASSSEQWPGVFNTFAEEIIPQFKPRISR